jgi:5-methylcytosine-specific restriction enzyme subunit McrC
MKNKNLIQVFEYQKLRFTDENGFTENHFKSLVKFNEENDNKYFKPIYNGIQFGSYVGVIQIGGLTIEILPKADKSNNSSQFEKDTWQGVLLHMLKICKKIQVDNVSETQLKKRYHSILNAYFEMYLEEIEQLIKKGFIKKYRKRQSNKLALKGKLIFSKNIQKNLVHKEQFYCEHTEYDKNHLIHQILLEGLSVLENLNTSHLSVRINRLKYQFDNINKKTITSTHFKKVILNRKSKPYERVLNIAKMLILNYSPNISYGEDNMLTLLFDMNMLWEEYIFRVLNKHKPENYQVSFQNSDTFWESSKVTKTIRPDIVIEETVNDITKTYVIDTKWKIRDNNSPDDSDLKQMFAYNLLWNSEKSLLLFPKKTQDDSNFGEFNHLSNEMKENKCKLGFVSVLENGEIKDGEKLSDEILKKLK